MEDYNKFGIEIEAVGVSTDTLRKLARDVNWSYDNDGSVRGGRSCIADIPCVGSRFSNQQSMGGELVSPIMHYLNEDWRMPVGKILLTLRRLGEGVSPRTSIHFHVNAKDASISRLLNLVKLWMAMEDGRRNEDSRELPVIMKALIPFKK